ncbi:hypothetical protein CEXT_191661 [Caerostris extrusa]|uniref:Uncharacterized protein n=1 Tax=Caerostris extrusa TaxID=172846 RepID=A0AAV4RC17_CAEEX|nr:hypothetical protein CEXT_191661 [Caerostris extrusa]
MKLDSSPIFPLNFSNSEHPSEGLLSHEPSFVESSLPALIFCRDLLYCAALSAFEVRYSLPRSKSSPSEHPLHPRGTSSKPISRCSQIRGHLFPLSPRG